MYVKGEVWTELEFAKNGDARTTRTSCHVTYTLVPTRSSASLQRPTLISAPEESCGAADEFFCR